MNKLTITRNNLLSVTKGEYPQEIELECCQDRAYFCSLNCAMCEYPVKIKFGTTDKYKLKLCKKEFIFDEVEDLRGTSSLNYNDIGKRNY